MNDEFSDACLRHRDRAAGAVGAQEQRSCILDVSTAVLLSGHLHGDAHGVVTALREGPGEPHR
ncbi:hypothetical protein [Nakamurella lactea]|uniref:hypothetical protein n=1 Tax=Nakamurella lactea TaxID=459515 RepID=UPI00048F943E|nr:hypothetical protein [Nakamurella lactea]